MEKMRARGSGRASLAVVFLTVVMDLIGFGMIVPLLSRYAEDFGAGGFEIGILFLSYALMQMVFSPVWGRLSDRVGRRPVLLCSIAGNVMALIVAGCASSYLGLLMARIVAGVCTSNIPVASAYVSDVTSDEERAKGMGLIGAARGIGFVIGPAIGGELSRFGMAAPFFGAAALASVNLIGAWFLLPESLVQGEGENKPSTSWTERLTQLRRTPVAFQLVKLGLIQMIAFSMLEMSYVLFLERRLELSASETGLYAGRVFTFLGCIMAFVQGGVFGGLVQRFGERRLVLTGLFLVATGMLALPLTPLGSWVLLLVFTGLVGLGQALVGPSLSTMLSKSTRADGQGAMLGVYHSALSLARIVGPPLAGVLFDMGGENPPYWVGGGLMLMAWFWALARLMPQGISAKRTAVFEQGGKG